MIFKEKIKQLFDCYNLIISNLDDITLNLNNTMITIFVNTWSNHFALHWNFFVDLENLFETELFSIHIETENNYIKLKIVIPIHNLSKEEREELIYDRTN